MASPTTAMSMIAEEIRAQADAVLKDAAEVSPVIDALSDPISVAEPESTRSLLSHSGIRVAYTDRSYDQADNESDLRTYTYNVLLWQSGEDQSDAGEALEAWAERVADILGDSTTNKSPLRTTPLPLSSLTPPNCVVWDIQMGGDSPGQVQVSESTFRPGRLLVVYVTVYRNRARP